MEFTNCHFYAGVSFFNCNFDSKVDFLGSHFYGPVWFNGAKFDSTVSFGCRFYNHSEFVQTKFYSFADFTLTVFDTMGNLRPWFALFDSARFFKKASFGRAEFYAKFRGLGMSVQDTLDFTSTVFREEFPLSQIIFGKDAIVNITHINAPSIRIDWSTLSGHLFIPKQNPAEVRETFSVIENGLEQRKAWEQLDDCIYERKLVELNNLPVIPGRLSLWFWGFGLKPWNIVFWIVCFLITMALILSRKQAFESKTKSIPSLPKRFIFGLEYSIGALFNVLQQTKKPSQEFRLLVQMFSAIGWFMLTLLIIAWSRQLIR
jgi:hypothetical protein